MKGDEKLWKELFLSRIKQEWFRDSFREINFFLFFSFRDDGWRSSFWFFSTNSRFGYIISLQISLKLRKEILGCQIYTILFLN